MSATATASAAAVARRGAGPSAGDAGRFLLIACAATGRIGRVYGAFGEPLVVLPGTIACEGVSVADLHVAGGDHVVTEAYVAPEIRVGPRVAEDRENDRRKRDPKRHTNPPRGVHWTGRTSASA